MGGAGIDTIGFGGSSLPLVIDVGLGFASVEQDSPAPLDTYATTFSGIEGLIGSPQDDVIYGDAGDNVINAGGGNDIIVASLGHDLLIGGAGDDTISFANLGAAVIVDLFAGEITILDPNEYDEDKLAAAILGVENVVGTSFDDLIIGNSSNNHLEGNGGADIIMGAGGDDSIFGHGGDDILLGGEGDDLIDGGAGNDSGNGDAGTDTCISSETSSNCEA